MTDTRTLRPYARAEQLGVRALADLVVGSRVPIAFLTATRRVLYCNEAACALFGRPLTRLQGCDVLDLFVAAGHRGLSPHLDPLLLDPQAVFSSVVRGDDGTEREVFGRSVTVNERDRQIVVLTMCDESGAHAASRAGTALARTAARLADGGDASELLGRISQHAVAGTSASSCRFVISDDDRDLPGSESSEPTARWMQAATDGAVRLGEAPGSPLVLPDARSLWESNPMTQRWAATLTSEDWRGGICLPLAWQGRVIGLCVLTIPPGATKLCEDEMAFVCALADQAALAVMSTRMARVARKTAGIAERSRLARDLHDSITQALFSITMHARAADLAMTETDRDGGGTMACSLASLTELSRGALAEMRALIFDLRPDALGDEGLVAALAMQAKALTARTDLTVVVHHPDRYVSIDPSIQEQLYRVVVETVQDVVDAARATRIELSVTAGTGHVRVTVVDDGAQPPDRSALTGRTHAIGARLVVAEGPAGETSVSITVPSFPGDASPRHPT